MEVERESSAEATSPTTAPVVTPLRRSSWVAVVGGKEEVWRRRRREDKKERSGLSLLNTIRRYFRAINCPSDLRNQSQATCSSIMGMKACVELNGRILMLKLDVMELTLLFSFSPSSQGCGLGCLGGAVLKGATARELKS